MQRGILSLSLSLSIYIYIYMMKLLMTSLLCIIVRNTTVFLKYINIISVMGSCIEYKTYFYFLFFCFMRSPFGDQFFWGSRLQEPSFLYSMPTLSLWNPVGPFGTAGDIIGYANHNFMVARHFGGLPRLQARLRAAPRWGLRGGLYRSALPDLGSEQAQCLA